MKLITAIIQPFKLDEVHEALTEAGITRITVNRVSGHGRQQGEELYRGAKVIPSLLPKIRLDIAVNEDFVEAACKTIMDSARTGEEGVSVGDGKIFITNLEECIRIGSGENGGDAI
jgi:nitrogen regulatory protein P-II 1